MSSTSTTSKNQPDTTTVERTQNSTTDHQETDVVYPFHDNINTLLEHQQQHQSKGNHTGTDGAATTSKLPQSTTGESDLSLFTVEERKKIRVAKAQAEIDRILSHPDGAPFDIESEMKKVVSINCDDDEDDEDEDENAPVPTTATSDENTQMEIIMDRHEEMTSYDIEGQLYDAIRKQDYSTAAMKQKALQQLQYDATIQVLQCNSAFYKAFSKKDYKSMELLWLPNDKHVLCIHPSHVPIVSSHNINQSWKQMFTSSSNSNFQKTWIEPTNIRINVRGNHMAIVTCDEQVYIRRFVRGQKRQTELINTLTATNIYYKLQQRWYMIHHHASWHPSSDAAKAALSRSTSSSSSSSYIASLKKRQEAFDAQNDGTSSTNNNNGLDGILGMKGVGPLLGDLKPKKLLSPASQQQNPPVPQRRIVMGSLSDILNGNLEDLLNGGGSGSMKNSDKKENDDDDDDDADEGSAIIQFHRVESEDDDDDDDDDDDIELELDDDDDDDDDDDNEISNTGSRVDGKKEAISMIQEWASRRGNEDEKVSRSKSSSSKKQPDVDSTMKRQQQQCLTLIRQLCAEGLISQQHKRTLLTDMISSSSSSSSSISGSSTIHNKSQIQLAYEFLFASPNTDDVDDDDSSGNETMYDIAREEFADQCRIIAESLSSSQS